MTTQITPRDWETLSAYLDDQLSAPERRELEVRLARLPELSQCLEELRSTRIILRSLPKLRAPRNFTLTPSMAGKRTDTRVSAGAYPLFKLASMLATLFFIVVSAGGLALRLTRPAQTIVLRADQSESAQALPAFGMGGGGGGGNAAPELALPAPTETDGLNPTATANMQGKAPAETETALLQVTPLESAMPEAPPAAAAPGAMPKAFSAVQGSPEAQSLELQAPQEISQQPPAARSQTAENRIWMVLAATQILLAILALASGAAALYLRRQARR